MSRIHLSELTFSNTQKRFLCCLLETYQPYLLFLLRYSISGVYTLPVSQISVLEPLLLPMSLLWLLFVFLEVILVVLGSAEIGAVILLVICTVIWRHTNLASFVTGLH